MSESNDVFICRLEKKLEHKNNNERKLFKIAPEKKGFNKEYEIIDNYVIVHITRKVDGVKVDGYFDLEDLKKVTNWDLHWNAVYLPDIDNYYMKATEYLGKINGKYKYRIHHFHIDIVDAPKGSRVDHINHNTMDNRKSNLRITDDLHNTKHRKSKNSNNKSGHRNVSWNGSGWSVQLMVEGKNTCLKRFKRNQLEEAGVYAEKMRKELYGEFAGKS